VAYIKAAAILRRIREVLEEAAGTLRVIPSTRFLGDIPDGLSDEEETRRALEKPRIAAALVDVTRSAASPPVTGNFIIYDVTLDVRIIRTLTTLEQISDDDDETLRALAFEDADVVRQALEYPGNLTQTSAAVATDLASGMLSHVRSTQQRARGAVNGGAQTLETIHRFTGYAFARPAVS
jgi:hypothetical protein